MPHLEDLAECQFTSLLSFQSTVKQAKVLKLTPAPGKPNWVYCDYAMKITQQYPRDIMSETVYGRVLALFKLGRRRQATPALKKAIDYLPLVRKELLKTKHRLPSRARPERITVGGADEAYYYWERSGQFWQEDPEALEWLRGMTRQATKTHRGKGQ